MSGQPTSERLLDTAARWEEYGETNTLAGILCDLKGGYCAQGEILKHAGFAETLARGVVPAFVGDDDKPIAGSADDEVAQILGITLHEAQMIRVLNDTNGERPVDYVRTLGRLHAAQERQLEATALVVGA